MMEFIDLKAQYRRIEPQVRARLDEVLRHGTYIMGPEIKELEERLAAFTKSAHCISCASGSDALLMVLMAWNIGPGDAVFVPAFTFFATAEMPALLGATPVFVDIDPRTFNMDPQSLEKAVAAVRARDASIHPLPTRALERSLRPACVIPVDLFGQAADYDAILPLAAREKLPVLEDAAQSFGGLWRGKRLCGLACEAAATSFFPAKTLGCYGDGGAIFTNDAALAAELLSIRIHGKGRDKYDNRRLGINGRLDTLQAAILLAKLEIFDDELARRLQVAQWYDERLTGLEGLIPPRIAAGNTSAYGQYTVRIPGGRRDEVAERLRGAGIPANVYYPAPQHVLSVFRDMGHRPEDMPVAALCAAEVLSLPMHPYLDEAAVDAVCAELKKNL